MSARSLSPILPTLRLAAVLLLAAAPAISIESRAEANRLNNLVRFDPRSQLGMRSVSVDELAPESANLSEWNAFRNQHGSIWEIYLDARSGVPAMVEGPGIPWLDASGAALLDGSNLDVDSLAASLLEFAEGKAGVLNVDVGELRLNREDSTHLRDMWMVVFDRYVDNVPVPGQRFVFYFKQGLLSLFGATRWTPIRTDPVPGIDAGVARERLLAYMDTRSAEIRAEKPPELVFMAIPADPGSIPAGADPSDDYDSALAWRIELRVAGEPGLWVGLIDAHSGEVLAFEDHEAYSQLQGGVYPAEPGPSPIGLYPKDQVCPLGCEEPLPIPFAEVRGYGFGPPPASTSSDGVISLLTSAPIFNTSFSGPYVVVHDQEALCQGGIFDGMTCIIQDDCLDPDRNRKLDGDCVGCLDVGGTMTTSLPSPSNGVVDLGFDPAYTGPPFPPRTDCDTPAGAYGRGDTHAARTSFYHANRAMQWARGWLGDMPGVGDWLNGVPVPLNVNVNLRPGTAVYSGGISVGKSSSLQHNMGQLAGTLLHEWGHGLDLHTGGYVRSNEGYADTIEILYDHTACIADGLYMQEFKNGRNRPYRFASAMFFCSGIRHQDWRQKSRLLFGACTNAMLSDFKECFQNIPTTPAGKDLWTANFGFPIGGGECGRDAHFESRIVSEAMYDLAAYDLTGIYGYDPASAWQIAERLWFEATPMMVGSLYTCSLGTDKIDPVEVYCDSPSRPVDTNDNKVQGLFGTCDRYCYLPDPDPDLGIIKYDVPCNDDMDCTTPQPDLCIASNPSYKCDQQPHACLNPNNNQFSDLRCADDSDCMSSSPVFTVCKPVSYHPSSQCPIEVLSSDGCTGPSLYNLLRMVDDVDGDLTNGTPHAAGIFAALDRHGLACKTAADPQNQDQISSYTINPPVLSFDGVTGPPDSGHLHLSWDHTVSGSKIRRIRLSYIVRRNDIGCDWSFQQVGTAQGVRQSKTSFSATFADEIWPEQPRPKLFYRVQPVVEILGSSSPNPTLWGPVSNCVAWP